MDVYYRVDDEDWKFVVFKGDEVVKTGYTHIVNLELYDNMSVEEYIMAFCL